MKSALLIEIAVPSHNNSFYESIFFQLVENEVEAESLSLLEIQNEGKMARLFSGNGVRKHEVTDNRHT